MLQQITLGQLKNELVVVNEEKLSQNSCAQKSARTKGAEAFFVCLREPLAIAL